MNAWRALQAASLRRPILILVLISFAARLPAAAIRFVIGSDEGLFLTLGQNLARGLGYTGNGVITQVDFPPGFSLFAAAVYALGGGPELPSLLNVLVIGALIPVPVYLLARLLLDARTAFLAALFTALVPALALAQGNFESVAEPLYTLLLYSAWAALLWGLRQPRVTPFALAGLALGAAHLVRWEGIVMAGLASGFIVLVLRRRALLPLVVLGITVALFAVPYAAFLYQRTGSVVSPKAAITQMHSAALDATGGEPFAYEEAYADYEAYLRNPAQPPEVPRLTPAEWLARYARNSLLQARLWLTSVSLMTPLWLLPALAGAWVLPRRKAAYLAALFVPLAAIPASVVDPRYFLPALPAAMILAAHGWRAIDGWLQGGRLRAVPAAARRWAAPGLVAGSLALFALADAAGPFLFPRPTEYRQAGLALRGHIPAGAHMLARKRQVPFYADAFWEWLPYGDLDVALAYAAEHDADYLVLDDQTTPQLRPQLAYLLDPASPPPSLTPIYVSPGAPRVVIYQIVR